MEQSELIEILNDISSNEDFHNAIMDNDNDVIRKISDDYFHRFQEVYLRIERHKYSEISLFLKDLVQDRIDILREGIRYIISSAEENEYNKDDDSTASKQCFQKINKLYDHIELETIRLSSINEIRVVANDTKNLEDDAKKTLDKSKEIVADAQVKSEKLSERLISILGIFSGIIITFSFATSITSGVFSNLSNANFLHIGCSVSLFSIIFLNIISLLFVFISKLSGHSLKSVFPKAIYIVSNVVCFFMFFYFRCCL